jgi:serine/threonine protein kinase/tetratricopeptide (TPR) repeat protein
MNSVWMGPIMDEFTSTAARAASSSVVEALLDDQACSWRRGERTAVETYLQRHPELRDEPDRLLDLIYHEVLLRTRGGETPQLAEYQRRFPELSEPLEDQFDVHRAMVGAPGTLARAVQPDSGETLPSAPAAKPLQTLGEYDILEELGRGGMGVVYKARHRALKRIVALKVIQWHGGRPEVQQARFRSEAEVLARLQHPNIVQIYEVGEHEGRPYLSLEYVTGGSLDQRIKGAPQPPRVCAELVETLARAMHAAHRAGVVHRDLKPANVLLQRDFIAEDPESAEKKTGEIDTSSSPPSSALSASSAVRLLIPKITDFGLAKQLDADLGHTRSGDVVGTPSYMAPEQAWGRKEQIGPLTDVYALGAILYEMLTGRPPFQADTVWSTMEQVGTQDPALPRFLQPKTPHDLETICLKCLHKEPSWRYPSAQALADDLRRWLDGKPIQARSASAAERGWMWVRRHPKQAGCIGAALASMALLFALHEVDLRDQVAKAEAAKDRSAAESTLADLRTHLSRVDVLSSNEAWGDAGTEAARVTAKAEQAHLVLKDDPQLKEILEGAKTRQEYIRRRSNDHRRRADLVRMRSEIVFLAAGPGSLDPAASRDRAERLAADALGLFLLRLNKGGPPALDGVSYSAAQRQEIREGLYEILLHLADAVADKRLAKSEEEQRRHAEHALAILDRARRLDVESPVWHARRARCLKRIGDAEGERVEQAAADGPLTRAFEWFLRGMDHFRANQLTEADLALQEALRHERAHVGARYVLAVCRLRRTDGASGDVRRTALDLARDGLTQCLEVQRDAVWPRLLRGFTLGEQREFRAALADYAEVQNLLNQTPDDAARYGLLVNRGVLLTQEGQFEEAARDLAQAVQLRPNDYPAYLNLAEVHRQTGQFSEAVEQLTRALALSPPALAQAALLRCRAHVHEEAKDRAAARRDLHEALQRDPKATADRLELARLLLADQQFAEALKETEAAPANDARVQVVRADALTGLGRYAEAALALGRAAGVERSRSKILASDYYVRQARQHVRAGDGAAAAEAYSQALGLDADAPEPLAGRAAAYVSQEAYRLALRDYERLVKLRPDDADALVGRGYARARLGQAWEAIADAEEALQRPTPTPQRLYNAARVLAQAAAQLEKEAGYDERARKQRERCLSQAVHLVSDALEALPGDQRVLFWRQTIQPDAALNPLRSETAFRRLAASYPAAGAGKLR